MLLFGAVLAGTAMASAAAARESTVAADKARAKALAAEIATLDGRIDQAVRRYARATIALDAVQKEMAVNRRLQRLARLELDIARSTLVSRAVALYKHDDVGTLEAMLDADDFSDLVDQMTLARHVARSDQEVLLTITRTRQQLARAALTLAAGIRTANELVEERSAEVAAIRARLGERSALLEDVRADIRRAATRQAAAAPTPGPTVGPETEGGSGPWWPLIKAAAAAQSVDARGLYRLMMIESGGSATAVNPRGFYGLFQYAPSTWKGSWNPYRAAAVTDGGAQIKATALAIHQGHGPSWWGASYSWAFQDR